MNYWLICLPREDLEHCMKKGVFGLSRKHILGNVKKGDRVICCAGKGDWKIIGLGEATSDYYIDDSSVFLKTGYFPDRFNFDARPLGAGKEVDVMKILDRLSFVSNLAYWAVYFRNGIAKCKEADWDLVTKAAKGNQDTAKVK